MPWIGNLRIGNQKPPISFEHMTSSRFLNFLERSYGFDAFFEEYIALLRRYARPREEDKDRARTIFTRFLTFPAPDR